MKDYFEIIEASKEDLLKDLKDLVAIRSVVSEAEGDSPFGKGVQQALDYILAKAEADGFVTKNVDNYGAHIDFPGKTDDICAIVGHLDVVPEGDLSNWNTDPYDMQLIDGKLFGRGCVDDKGPLMSAYYAMKALKEAGFEPEKTVRIILGCDEETEWKGMEYYMEREKAPVCGFSPDAEFPAIHAEKGLIIFDIKKAIDNKDNAGTKLVSFTGGTVPNAVADGATAVITSDNLEAVTKVVEKYILDHEFQVRYEVVEENKAVITVKGISAHGSQPELGVNAITIMFDILGGITFNNADVNDAISFYNNYIGFDIHGERIGMCLVDEPSGNLAFNVGVVSLTEDEFVVTVNARYPVTFELEDVYAGTDKIAAENGYTVERIDFQPPLYKSVDDPLIKTLMAIYAKHTGDTESKPLVIGGATYARAVPNTVAFGPVLPGDPDLCHQPNEYIKLDDLYSSVKIFAEAIYELAK